MYTCSKRLLHNKFSKRIYPGTIRPLSNSTKTEFHALNATQGHKFSYTTSYIYRSQINGGRFQHSVSGLLSHNNQHGFILSTEVYF